MIRHFFNLDSYETQEVEVCNWSKDEIPNMIQTSFQVCNKLKPPHPTLDITLSGFSWMSALARNDITYDSTRAARDHLRVSNWAPFQSPTNAAVFTKGSALGGFGLCWKRFCYAAMLLVVPLVISLVHLKVLDCSRCQCFHFLDEDIWKQSIHFLNRGVTNA